MDKRTAAVVVTYNRKELLKENIERLLAQSMQKCLDVVIIDNASTDGTREYISLYIEEKQVHYTNTGANLGGAGGFQFGVRYAAEGGYDFVWLMDDDCMPTPTALEEFYRWDERLKGNYGFLSSKVLWTDGGICTMNVQKKDIVRKVRDFTPQMIPVEMASFVSLFVPISVVREVGLPIKEFFIWTDDWEYTRRISRKYPCYLITSSVVTHKSVSNIGANIATDTAERLDRYNYLYRNDVYLYRREGLNGFLYEATRLSFHVLRVLLKAKNHKWKRVRCIIRGTKAGFRFHPEIEYVRESDT